MADVVAAGNLAQRVPVAVAALDASRFWCSVNFGLRPSLTPRAFARSRHSPVPARIRSRSNRELGAAVAAAYGWPAEIGEEDALAQLLELNRKRAAAGR